MASEMAVVAETCEVAATETSTESVGNTNTNSYWKVLRSAKLPVVLGKQDERKDRAGGTTTPARIASQRLPDTTNAVIQDDNMQDSLIDDKDDGKHLTSSPKEASDDMLNAHFQKGPPRQSHDLQTIQEDEDGNDGLTEILQLMKKPPEELSVMIDAVLQVDCEQEDSTDHQMPHQPLQGVDGGNKDKPAPTSAFADIVQAALKVNLHKLAEVSPDLGEDEYAAEAKSNCLEIEKMQHSTIASKDLSDMIDAVLQDDSDQASRRLLHVVDKESEGGENADNQAPRLVESKFKPGSIWRPKAKCPQNKREKESQRLTLTFVELLRRQNSVDLLKEVNRQKLSGTRSAPIGSTGTTHPSHDPRSSMVSHLGASLIPTRSLENTEEAYTSARGSESGLTDLCGRTINFQGSLGEESQYENSTTECQHELYLALWEEGIDINLDAFVGIFHKLAEEDGDFLNNTDFIDFVDKSRPTFTGWHRSLVVLTELPQSLSFWVPVSYVVAGLSFTLGAYKTGLGISGETNSNLYLSGTVIYLLTGVYGLYQRNGCISRVWSLVE